MEQFLVKYVSSSSHDMHVSYDRSCSIMGRLWMER